MGGYGSGRWGRHRKKICVEQCLVIDTALWMREGILYQRSTYSRGALFCLGFRVNARNMSCPVAHLT